VVLLAVLVLGIAGCGGKKEESGAEANTPPEIKNITLLPLNPTVESEITARILSSDREGDPITYDVAWYVNGDKIGEGMALSYDEIKKGDRIFADVTPYDSKAYGKTTRSGEITIGGLPPRILSLSIIPELVYVNTPQVAVNALFEDPDGDEIKLIVHWLVKDETLTDTSSILQMARLGLKKNDVITGAAFADDGELRSEAFTFEIPISNSPPAFSTRIDSVKCSTDSVYYQLPIYDPDGDPITFEILDAPSGINIDAQKGVIYGTAGEGETFEVAVRATDSDGAYLDAQFTLTAK
jgi:hypothetical protein